MCIPEIIEKVQELVNSNRRLSIQVFANELHIAKELDQQILTQDQRKRDLRMSRVIRSVLEINDHTLFPVCMQG